MLMISLLFAAAGARVAEAHASLVESVPAANSSLAQPPDKVSLTFNERLEEGLYYLRVFDAEKRKVTERSAVMNATKTVLALDLPKLQKGTYIVTYHVISADGHPVDGTYLFAVGQSLDAIGGEAAPQLGHPQGHGGLIERFTFGDGLRFASRIAFYMSMLAFTGWLLWMRWFGSSTAEPVRARLKLWGERLQQSYLIIYILFMWAHLWQLVGDAGAQGLLRLFASTGIGYAWIGGLLLALLSFVLLYRSALLDYVWVALVWVAKSFLGHAAAFEPKGETILLDWLHLAAASVWVGGLLLMLVLWSTAREEARRLYGAFSLAALLSIILLIVSGVASVFIFLPDIAYVTETAWGTYLLVKSGLVLLVVITATLIRFAYRRRKEASVGLLVRTDGGLMSLIVAIVGIFTYLTPLPVNEPLNWHVMGNNIHMTAQINPAATGVNDFTVKVWLPEPLGKPKQIIYKLQEQKSADIAPIEVPLEPFEDQSFDESYGMKKYSFKARGPYIPYPGYWKLEIRVMNSADDETVYEKTIRVY
ncbi:copper resistance protein CopC [Paenibacillus solanacearum]|nr:copper resistance protein CopC [Paenibacillus solanacearum]